MFEDYERQLAKRGGGTMSQEGYGTSMQAAEDLTDGYLLTEAVTEYAERATQSKERTAQMEAKSEEKSLCCPFRNRPSLHNTRNPSPPHRIPNTSSRGLATKGFVAMPLVDILTNLQRLYRKLRY